MTPDSRPPSIRILHVDDNPYDIALVRETLENSLRDVEIVYVASFTELNKALKGNRFDLVLTDFNILGYSDFDVVEHLREKVGDIPIILLTSSGSEEVAIEALRRGIDDYVIKAPVHIQQLPYRIQAVLERHRLKHEKTAAEVALRLAFESFRNVVHSSPDAIFLIDDDLRVLYVNQAAEAFFGQPTDALLGEPFTLPIVKDRPSEVDVVHPDGEMRCGEMQVVPVVWECKTVTMVVIRDITERRQAAEALRKSEERFRLISETISDYAYAIRVRADGNIVLEWVTESFARVTGYATAEFEARDGWNALIHPEDRHIARQWLANLCSGQDDVCEFRIVTKSGDIRWLRVHGRPVWDDAQTRVVRIYGAAQDITEQVHSHRLLHALNNAAASLTLSRTLDEIISVATEALHGVSHSCVLLLLNAEKDRLYTQYLSFDYKVLRNIEQLVGERHEEFSIAVEDSGPYRDVVREKKTVFIDDVQSVMRQWLPRWGKRFTKQIAEMLNVSKAIAAPISFDGEVMGVVSVQSNTLTPEDKDTITVFAYQMSAAWQRVQYIEKLKMEIAERKQAEEALQELLTEKETLIRELYHRTKNNMQVISSMLELESLYTDDDQVNRIFLQIQNRIQVMALVHEKLYQSRHLSRLSLDDYIRELIHLIMRAYPLIPGKVGVVFDMEPISTLFDIAVPCGLVVNELFSNALEHAFPDGREGTIRVSLHRSAPGQLTLMVSDNGVGLPPGFDVHKTDTLGLLALTSIVEHQLQGQVEFEDGSGLTCRVTFREDLYDERV